jgi:hypothetical protein
LTATRGEAVEELPVAAPLGDKICCPVADLTLRAQICAQLQLLAAAQLQQHPWLDWTGLYRVIVPPDRRSAVMANRPLLEAIGQSIEMHEVNQGAFAFPCERGIVVVLPMHIVAYALAPDTEAERQYGFTTVWHELAHVHALALDYWPQGKLRLPRQGASLQLASNVRHEFFANRHAHWPSFSCDFEHRLVEAAWHAATSSPTAEQAGRLLVNLAHAYGKLGASRTGASFWMEALPTGQASMPIALAWQACARELDNALRSLHLNHASPDMSALELSSQAWLRAWLHAHKEACL